MEVVPSVFPSTEVVLKNVARFGADRPEQPQIGIPSENVKQWEVHMQEPVSLFHSGEAPPGRGGVAYIREETVIILATTRCSSVG